jgi:hypothetical protein
MNFGMQHISNEKPDRKEQELKYIKAIGEFSEFDDCFINDPFEFLREIKYAQKPNDAKKVYYAVDKYIAVVIIKVLVVAEGNQYTCPTSSGRKISIADPP